MNVSAHHWDALIKQMHDANLLTYYHLFDNEVFKLNTLSNRKGLNTGAATPRHFEK